MPLSEYILDLVGVGAGAGVSYILYSLVCAGKEAADNLKNTPELELNTELINRVTENGGRLLACVTGNVQSTEGALRSLAKPEVSGVVWKHTITEHIVAQVFGFWVNDKRVIDSSYNKVPFIIMENGIGVQVADPNKLDGADLTIVSDKFEAATNSLTDHLFGWMKGVRSTGTQQTEEMLVEGTHVLGIGNLVLRGKALFLDYTNHIPYIVTLRDKKTVIDDLEAPIPFLRFLTVISVLGTAFYTYRVLSRWYSRWRKDMRRRREEQTLEAARLRREAQNHDLPESLMCVVCCDLRDVLLMPCKHVCVCSDCALKLDPRVCPVCRTEIETIQPVFYS